MQLLLLIAYPLCVHYAVVTVNPEAQLLALVLLAAGISYPGIKQNSTVAWLTLLSVIALSLLISYFQLTLYVLYLPPVIIPLLLWTVFFRSLLPGETPLTTQIGESVHGPFSPEMRHYSRQVTVLWAVFFVLMAGWSALLPFLASDKIWSLFTSFINYLLVGMLFVAEYFHRKWRFRQFNHLAFWQYLQLVARANIRKL
jgi:uncharacterized membrane protein